MKERHLSSNEIHPVYDTHRIFMRYFNTVHGFRRTNRRLSSDTTVRRMTWFFPSEQSMLRLEKRITQMSYLEYWIVDEEDHWLYPSMSSSWEDVDWVPSTWNIWSLIFTCDRHFDKTSMKYTLDQSFQFFNGWNWCYLRNKRMDFFNDVLRNLFGEVHVRTPPPIAFSVFLTENKLRTNSFCEHFEILLIDIHKKVPLD